MKFGSLSAVVVLAALAMPPVASAEPATEKPVLGDSAGQPVSRGTDNHLVRDPRTPSVKVSRQGRFLKLDYELLDHDGQKCAINPTNDPPQFVVFKNGQQIGSGSFEYG